ncbi:MAG: transposase, partial [Candidatus Omnitrophota bacterium]
IAEYKKEERINIAHYCLMPNHVHFLVKVTPESDLANFMKRLNLSYFFHYRRKRAYVGHLWQGRFKSKLIEKDDYFIQCGKYIELNPVRKGLCTLPEEYAFSSYEYYAYGKKDILLDENPLYSDFGKTAQERQASYRKMITDEIIRRKMTFSNHMKRKKLGAGGTSP